MRRLLLAALATVALIRPVGLEAQRDSVDALLRPRPDPIPFAPLARPSYGWVMQPEGAMYEGDLNIPVHLWSRTEALSTIGDGEVNSSWWDCAPWPVSSIGRSLGARMVGTPSPYLAKGCTVTFVPHFVVRQLESNSAPVRSPTFNPGFDINFHRLGITDRDEAGNVPPNPRTGTMLTAILRLAHYSNGQSGCLYTNQLHDPARDACVVQPGLPERPNTEDGSFSTDYAELGGAVSWLHFNDAGYETLNRSLSVVYRISPPGLEFMGGMSDELARTYGRSSFLGRAMVRARHGRTFGLPYRSVKSLELDGECAAGRPEPYGTCRGSATAFLAFPGLYGFGISARYVGGWDYYNAGYGREYQKRWSWVPVLGVVIDHTRAITIRRP